MKKTVIKTSFVDFGIKLFSDQFLFSLLEFYIIYIHGFNFQSYKCNPIDSIFYFLLSFRYCFIVICLQYFNISIR